MLVLRLVLLAVLVAAFCAGAGAEPPRLPGTAPLTGHDDLAKSMVEGIHAYLDGALRDSVAGRAALWHRDLTDGARYEASVSPNRERLRRMIGAQDARERVVMRFEPDAADRPSAAGPAATGRGYKVYRVRWNVFRGVEGAGLLLLPNASPHADVVALPDCDATPEMLAGLAPGLPAEAQYARRLAESGFRVLVPALIDRGAAYSGNPAIAITNQPHREFLYRAAYELGRTIVGYEVQKTLAAVDWLAAHPAGTAGPARRGASGGAGERQAGAAGHGAASEAAARPIGLIGYGEGGLIALYSAALDTRIAATVVSGYFAPRETRMAGEPIYRNVFGLLREFGDAEIASLIAPRQLIVEASRGPEVAGPPQTGRITAASGALAAVPLAEVEAEFRRADALTAGLRDAPPRLVASADGHGPPGSESALRLFLAALKPGAPLAPAGPAPRKSPAAFDVEARRKRQFDQIAEDTQVLMRESPLRRKEYWAHADFATADALERTTTAYRAAFWDEVIGRLPPPPLPPNPRSRQVYDTPKFTGYEVTLDLYPGVFAYGILLVPKNIPAGERRPVVVCQHGLEGKAQDVADPAVDNHYYHRFACRLAERGYVTFAPQNPYIGQDRFRTALRKAQPLKLTLFSFIVRQHEALLTWLGGLPFVDPARIAFYGLSYGGKTAMRVPAVLPGYCLSICSGDYNEWIWKCCSMSSPYSYLFTNEYDMPEWNLAETFNYAEMSWLIFPRPFMVERGHGDSVAPDEWVAYEYARTRHVYDTLGLGDRTELEMFNGPHTIHGVGTFAFLDRRLKMPK
jgi:dienelactone hydrolase